MRFHLFIVFITCKIRPSKRVMEIRAAAGKGRPGGGGGAVSWLNKTDWRGLSLTGKTGRGEGSKNLPSIGDFFWNTHFTHSRCIMI